MKEETKCYCDHTTYCDCGPEESKQETLEEAVLRVKSENEHYIDEEAFELGVKWQQERMYSEEEMKSAFKIGFSIGYGSPVNGLDSKEETCDVWFEQFKKK